MGTTPVIMLVDDSKEDRDLFSMAFRTSRVAASLIAVHSVADLYDRLVNVGGDEHHRRPDLMVLDLAMPGLDANAMIRYLRQHFQPVRIPVVILTGSMRESDRKDCMAMGVDDYQVKPALFSDLVAYVTSLSRFLPATPGAAG